MQDMAKRRQHMVDVHIARRGVRDHRVLEARRSVSREPFVSEAMAEFAYEDSPLPIEEEQTISQPYIVAAMIEAAEIGPGDRVLEVGAGSGYAAAVIAQIADEVYADQATRGRIEARIGRGAPLLSKPIASEELERTIGLALGMDVLH